MNVLKLKILMADVREQGKVVLDFEISNVVTDLLKGAWTALIIDS